MPSDGEVLATQIVDQATLNPARVSQIAGVWRLAVDATFGGVVPISDVDDDAVALGQTTLLSIVENYASDGTNWRRLQVRDFNTAADVDEGILGLLTNARMAMRNTTLGDWTWVGGDLLNAISGTSPAAANAIYAAASVVGEDNTGAAVLRPVEARDAGAASDFDSALIGLTTNSRMAIFRNATSNWNQVYGDLPSAVSGTSASIVVGPYANAITVGLDNTGAAVLRPVEARLLNTLALPNTGYGLATLSMTYGYDLTNNDPRQIHADGFTNISGRTLARGLYTNSVAVGIDNTGAAVLRPVEARTFDVRTNATYSGLVKLATTAQMFGYDFNTPNANITSPMVLYGTSVSNNWTELAAGLCVYDARESGFAASRRGKRFYTTHQTPGTLITCQTAFVATTPSFLLRVNSAAIRDIIRSFNFGIANTPGGTVYFTVVIDTSDRYSAGGNAHTPQNVNEESATAAVSLFYDSPTLAAAGGGTRYVVNGIAPATPGTTVNIDFKDGVLLGATAASFAVYIWAASTAPQVTFGLEHEEVA